MASARRARPAGLEVSGGPRRRFFAATSPHVSVSWRWQWGQPVGSSWIAESAQSDLGDPAALPCERALIGSTTGDLTALGSAGRPTLAGCDSALES